MPKVSDLTAATTPLSGAEILYVVQGGNSRKTTVSELSSGVATVKDFGAVGDGVTNDAPAIQAAFNAIGATGGALHFPRGSYRVNSTVTLDAGGVTLSGDGAETVIVNGTTNLPAVVLGNASTARTRIKVRNLRFGQASGVTAVSGNCGLQVLNIEASSLEDLHFLPFPQALFRGMDVSSAVEVAFDRIEVQDCLNDGIRWIDTCIDMYINACRSDANGASGYSINDSEGFYVTNCSAFGNASHGWTIGPNLLCRNLFFVNCIGDTSGSHNWLCQNMTEAYFTQCWGATQIDTGVNTFANGFSFSGANCRNIALNGCIGLKNNSHGIFIDNGANKITITNFVAGTDSVAGRGNGQSGAGFGIKLGGTAGTDFRLIGGQAYANASGAFSSDVTLPFNAVQGLIGYTTANAGNASLSPNGSGNANIAHGLPAIPTSASVFLVGDTSIEATIQSIDATNIVVRLRSTDTNADQTSSSFPVRWRAEL